MASVTFFGACGVVTGSCSMLEHRGQRLLVDCGMYQGGEDLEQRNRAPFHFEAEKIDAVLLTHAHLDHSGLLPKLAREGFDGPIICTGPSRGLTSLVLEDSAKLQEEAAEYARRKGYSRHRRPEPLYTVEDAKKAIRALEPHPFDSTYEAIPGLTVEFHRAGHLLGAASIEIVSDEDPASTWLFSGDVGRWGRPILKDPEPPRRPPTALLLESTYGDREHEKADTKEQLAEIIEKVYARRGKVIVPAFALGRTQEVMYYLSELVDDGRLDPGTVFLDSPMAISATELYDRAQKEHDEDFAEMVRSGENPLGDDRFSRCASVEQSKALNSRSAPAVIIAASGMATGGRVVHHLLHNLSDPQSAVVFVGYQASGTRGQALVNGARHVGIHGQSISVRAEIHLLHGLSAHADRDELIRWCGDLPGAPKRIFLNHGEDPARKALAAEIRKELGWMDVDLPASGTRVDW